MKIKDIVCSPGYTGFFFDDQAAIKAGAREDGNTYIGEPVTEGFAKIRMAGEAVSVMFILDDGQVAFGDCAAVQYSGAGGRDPLFLAADFIPIIEREIKPLFVGQEITNFKDMARLADKHVNAQTGNPLHTAIRYGVTQAVLDAVAKSQKTIMAKIVAEEYGLTVSDKLIPIFSQSGDERYKNVDSMVIKGADVLPHGLINNLKKLGKNGETLIEYVAWLAKRTEQLSPYAGYKPVLHIDVYGTMGLEFSNDLDKIAQCLDKVAKAASPLTVRIEGPIDLGSRAAQIEGLAKLREMLDRQGTQCEIVADEWCNTVEDVIAFTNAKAGHMAQIKTPDLGGIDNTIEAVLYCKQNGFGAYLGGTCNETDRSAQVSAHIAMATKPAQILAKPGMGVDEGFMIVFNEMNRVLALKDVM
ncbi:MAG: methylaspartate ammonia-lyase [Oscillospiraceae bacterium]|nr:methylaspartate ammonia-lyase [Oscillospiraceae bacterium]